MFFFEFLSMNDRINFLFKEWYLTSMITKSYFHIHESTFSYINFLLKFNQPKFFFRKFDLIMIFFFVICFIFRRIQIYIFFITNIPLIKWYLINIHWIPIEFIYIFNNQPFRLENIKSVFIRKNKSFHNSLEIKKKERPVCCKKFG